jgi:CHAT domain-containing protein
MVQIIGQVAIPVPHSSRVPLFQVRLEVAANPAGGSIAVSRLHNPVMPVRRLLLPPVILCALLATTNLAHGQEAHWLQLMQQVKQLLAQDNNAAALQVAQQSAQVAQATWGTDDAHLALSLDAIGNIQSGLGNYSGAEGAYRQALTLDSKLIGQSNIQTAHVMAHLARLYGSHGQFGLADQLFQQALPVYLKEYGQTDARVAELVFNASDVLLSEAHFAHSNSDAEAKYNSANSGFQLAAAVYQKAEGEWSVGLAHCYDRLASITEDGGVHATAEKLHKRAIEILEKAYGPDSLQLTDSLEGLARVYKDQQHYGDAEPIYLRVLKIDQAHLKPDNPDLRDAEADLAGLYFSGGRPAQAVPYFQAYLGNLMDEFRANAATMSERERLIYFAAFHNAYPLFFSFVLKYHAQMPELTGQMYDAVLQEKGLIAESAAAMRAAVEASGDQQAVAMLDKLARDKAQLATLSATTGNPSSQAAQLQQEANSLEQALMKRSAAMVEQKAQNAATWRDVQKALKPGESAVEVVRFQYETGATVTGHLIYVALVVTPESKQPEFVLLGEATNLEAAPMLAFRDNVAQTRGFTAVTAPSSQAAAASTSAAYAAFWKPLEPALGSARRVYLSPDGVLNSIPIGLMADPDGKLVMEKYQLRIVNSTRDLLRPTHSAQLKSALLVGNPKFDLTAPQQKAAVTQLRGFITGSVMNSPQSAAPPAIAIQTTSRGGELKGSNLNPLPGTQIEVDSVDKLLKTAGWRAAEFTGELALKDAVTQAHGPRVLHIATHGFFLSDEDITANPAQQANLNQDPMLRAGLFFAGADRVRQGATPEQGVDDGVLTAFEASQLNLQGTELVVLSACETGLGKEVNGEGVFGLRRGLQEAGADAVMMSMWSVPDKETQELMALFYTEWLSGKEKPEALRQAQLKERETVRQRYGKDLPFYWGAFVLVGR